MHAMPDGLIWHAVPRCATVAIWQRRVQAHAYSEAP